jgi:hypothetical protein
MTDYLKTLLLFLLVIPNCSRLSGQQDSIKSKNSQPLYLGQVPPNDTPEFFAPGIVTRDDYFEHSSPVFSQKCDEVFWSARQNGQRYLQIYFIKLVDGKWSDPTIVSFSGNYNLDNPALSSDGRRLFFASDMPPYPGSMRKDWNIWVVTKDGDIWSQPSMISDRINSTYDERGPSISQDGSLYFTRIIDHNEYIYVSDWDNQKFLEPQKLDNQVNPGFIDVSIGIAPDESYMLLEIPVNDIPAIYVSYKQQEDKWSKPCSLSLGWSRLPYVSPDKKYLFFMTREGIYWRDTSVINKLKPEQTNNRLK